jgi:hypothetical protein
VECPLAESLWRIVRRILRTQSKRTCFEIRVLEEVRRLARGWGGGITRDLLAKLVVDHLLASHSAGHMNSNPNEPGLCSMEGQVLLSASAVDH